MTATASAPLRVGMVGAGFMSAAHSHGWRNAARAFSLPREPVLAAIASRETGRAEEAATRLGWEQIETHWERLISRSDIDVIDICTPGDLHGVIAIAALDAGKHVLCEKPLANSMAEAEEMAAAARRAAGKGVFGACGFTYRRQPANALARSQVAAGRLGTIRHVRVQYLQDWLTDSRAPYSWRLDVARSGSGVLGDLGAHAVDLVRWITGEDFRDLVAMLDTFVHERPIEGSRRTAKVIVDDSAVLIGHLVSGATVSIEVSRFATGRKNSLRWEINGSAGSLAFDLERNNELHHFDASADPATQGFARVLVTEPSHPYLEGWWPAGHTLGYDHGFVNQAADFVRAIGTGVQPEPSFENALGVQRVLEAVARSSTTQRWESAERRGASVQRSGGDEQ